jgi:hypothetical protein
MHHALTNAVAITCKKENKRRAHQARCKFSLARANNIDFGPQLRLCGHTPGIAAAMATCEEAKTGTELKVKLNCFHIPSKLLNGSPARSRWSWL